MYNYNEMKSNYKTIKEFCIVYRTELTNIGGVLGELNGMVTRSEYEKFMNELSVDEFIGNYLTGLLSLDVIEQYRQVLNGDMTIRDFVKLYFDEDIANKSLGFEG